MKYQPAIIPFGVNYGVFNPIARALKHSLMELGSYGEGKKIVFGAWGINAAAPTPEDWIIYNLEIIGSCPITMRHDFFERFYTTPVWDFSAQNIARLEDKCVTAAHLPIGWSPAFEFQPHKVEQDIDVFFVGSMNKRRRDMLRALQESGLNVVVPNNVFGHELESYWSRSKIVLNIPFYRDAPVNMVRLAPCWANGIFVLSEHVNLPDYKVADAHDPSGMLVEVDECEFVDLAHWWIDHPKERREQAALARYIFQCFPMTKFLAEVIE